MYKSVVFRTIICASLRSSAVKSVNSPLNTAEYRLFAKETFSTRSSAPLCAYPAVLVGIRLVFLGCAPVAAPLPVEQSDVWSKR
jgi:hypothetical protein